MEVEDTFAEAFDGYYARILITAKSEEWLMAAINAITGYATSCTGCSCEAGIDRFVGKEETPDTRTGAIVQLWVPKREDALRQLEEEIVNRINQCVLPIPTTAVFDAKPLAERLPIGKKLGYFGDGYQRPVRVYSRRMIAVPIMMGEFLVEEDISYGSGIMGGNLIVMCSSEDTALRVAKEAYRILLGIEGVITPFPNAACASGSKVGSRSYAFLKASTDEAFCPTLRSLVASKLPPGVGKVIEIVINGVNEFLVRKAMRDCLELCKRTDGVVGVTARNYEGKLGKHKFWLRRL